MTSSSFGNVIGTPRDELPDISSTNYLRTETDLTKSVNDQIDRNILDTKDFHDQMIKIAELRQKNFDDNLKALGGLVKGVNEFRKANDAYNKSMELMKESDDLLEKGANKLEEDAINKLKIEEGKQINELKAEGSSSAQDLATALTQPSAEEVTTKDFVKGIEEKGFYDSITTHNKKLGFINTALRSEAVDKHNESNVLAVATMLQQAKDAGVNIDSRQFRRLFRQKLYPKIVARTEANLLKWEQSKERKDEKDLTDNLDRDIESTLQSYSDGSNENRPAFIPDLDGENGLITRIQVAKGYEDTSAGRKQAIRYLLERSESLLKDGSLGANELTLLKDVAVFRQGSAQDKLVPFRDLLIGNGKDRFVESFLGKLDRAFAYGKTDADLVFRANSQAFKEKFFDPLLKDANGNPIAISDENYYDLRAKWSEQFPDRPFPEYIQSGGIETGSKYGSYPNRAGKANTAFTSAAETLEGFYREDLFLKQEIPKQNGQLSNTQQLELKMAKDELNELVLLKMKNETMTYEEALVAKEANGKTIGENVLEKLQKGKYRPYQRSITTNQNDIVASQKEYKNSGAALAEKPINIHEKQGLDQLVYNIENGMDIPAYWKAIGTVVVNGKTYSPYEFARLRLIQTGGMSKDGSKLKANDEYYDISEEDIRELERLNTPARVLGVVYKDKKVLAKALGTLRDVKRDVNGKAIKNRKGETIAKGDGEYIMISDYKGGKRFRRTGIEKRTIGELVELAKAGKIDQIGRYSYSTEEFLQIYDSDRYDKNDVFNEDTQSTGILELYMIQANQSKASSGAIIGNDKWLQRTQFNKQEAELLAQVFPGYADQPFNNFDTFQREVGLLALSDFEQRAKEREERRLEQSKIKRNRRGRVIQ